MPAIGRNRRRCGRSSSLQSGILDLFSLRVDHTRCDPKLGQAVRDRARHDADPGEALRAEDDARVDAVVGFYERFGFAPIEAFVTAGAFDAAWRNWVNPYAPVEQFSADEIEAIHDASLRVLEETGIRVLSPNSCDLYRGAGMTVGAEGVVRFDADALLELIAT